MKIFLPFKKELNPYLDQIINNSVHTFCYDNYLNFNASYDVVNIHWPEALFEWKEPTITELDVLEESIIKWKKNAIIIYTKHDYQRNKGTTPNFSKLFELIEKNTDVFIHLGEYSRKKYSQIYPQTKHEIIYHPIFEDSFEMYSKAKARKLLKIDPKAIVVIAPGKIRSFKERSMVLRSFRALKIKNKVLVSTNMRTELKFDFPGRLRMRKYFDAQKFFVNKFKSKYLPPRFYFSYDPLTNAELSMQMSAADVVLVPRLDLLNSGIVFLGLTFGKMTVGPAIGNIKEQLKELNYPVFDPYSISSVTEALEKGIKLHQSGEYSGSTPAKYKPINVAKEYEMVFLKYKKQ